MIAVKVPDAGVTIELHNESKLRAAFCDFERKEGHGRRVLLEPDERKRVPLLAGMVYITPCSGVVIHGL